MDENWFPRLIAAIEADGRSKRQISVDAGFGVNYVQQMINDGKEPGAKHLQGLLKTLGSHRMFFILTGVDIRPEDKEFVQVALEAPPKVRDRMRDLMLELLASGDKT